MVDLYRVIGLESKAADMIDRSAVAVGACSILSDEDGDKAWPKRVSSCQQASTRGAPRVVTYRCPIIPSHASDVALDHHHLSPCLTSSVDTTLSVVPDIAR